MILYFSMAASIDSWILEASIWSAYVYDPKQLGQFVRKKIHDGLDGFLKYLRLFVRHLRLLTLQKSFK